MWSSNHGLLYGVGGDINVSVVFALYNAGENITLTPGIWNAGVGLYNAGWLNNPAVADFGKFNSFERPAGNWATATGGLGEQGSSGGLANRVIYLSGSGWSPRAWRGDWRRAHYQMGAGGGDTVQAILPGTAWATQFFTTFMALGKMPVARKFRRHRRYGWTYTDTQICLRQKTGGSAYLMMTPQDINTGVTFLNHQAWQLGHIQGDYFELPLFVTYPPVVALNTANGSSFSTGTPTLECTATDPEGDPCTYEIDINGPPVLSDSYSETFKDVNVGLSATFTAMGQSFHGVAGLLTSVKFDLEKFALPTGNATAVLYAHTGTFGTSGKPTGSPLATSDPFDVATLSSSNFARIEFFFSGNNIYKLANGVDYCIVLQYSGSDATNKVAMSTDQSSPTHPGCQVRFSSGAWSALTGVSCAGFYIYTASDLLDKVSDTDPGFANTVTGGDIDPFNSGEKVSYIVQAGDSLNNGTYYWTARAKDPTGTNTYGDWAPYRSFNIAAAVAYIISITKGSFALAGQPVSVLWGQRAIALPPGNFALSGQTVLFPRGKSMPIVQGAFTLTGQVLNLLHKQILGVTQGAYTLTGQAQNLLRGKLIPLVKGNYALNGQLVTMVKAKVLTVPQGAYSLSGQPVNLLFKRLIGLVKGQYNLTGQPVTLSRPRILTVVQGAYALTGKPVGLPWKHIMGITQGAYALGGQVLNFLRGRNMSISQGAYNLAGIPVTLTKVSAKILVAVQGAYALSGQAANLLFGRKIVNAQGSYALNGQAMNFLRGIRMVVAQGAYSLNGQVLLFLRTRIMPLAQGAYALNGQVLNFLRGRRIAIVQGAYALTGQAVNFVRPRFMPIVKGAYALTGQITNLLRSRNAPLVQGSYSLSGQPVSFPRGRIMSLVQGAYTFTGNATNFFKTTIGHYIMNVSIGLYSLGGPALNFLRSRKVPLTQMAYSLNGQPQGFLRGRNVPLIQGAYSLSGQPVSFSRPRIMTLVRGLYALSGQVTNLLLNRRGSLTQGSYALNGQAANLLRARKLPIVLGTFTLAGQPVILLKTTVGAFVIPVGTGFFNLSGQPVSLRKSSRLVLPQGSYVLNGQPVSLGRGRSIVITKGSYALNGQPVAFRHTWKMPFGPGAFNLSGQPVILVYTPVGHFILAASSGAFSLVGQPAALKRGRSTSLVTGAFNLSGRPIAFSRGDYMQAANGHFDLTGGLVTPLWAHRLSVITGLYTTSGIVVLPIFGRKGEVYKIVVGPEDLQILKIATMEDLLALQILLAEDPTQQTRIVTSLDAPLNVNIAIGLGVE